MNSTANALLQEQLRKEQIEKEIAKLQAQLKDIPDVQPSTTSAIPNAVKRKSAKQAEATVLAPATPSPRKKRRIAEPQPESGSSSIAKVLFQPASKLNPKRPPRPSTSQITSQVSKPSTLLEKLAEFTAEEDAVEPEPVNRTSSFSERAEPGPSRQVAQKRDERLMLVDDFKPGPYIFEPPIDDPNFDKFEPHSGIALSSRVLSHKDFANHLEDRYYLSPSQLYSCARLQPDKQGYDIPVPGDWVTIAVIAERGPVRMTKAPITLGPDEDADPKSKWKKKDATKDNKPLKPHGKHFMNMKLVDFGARSKSSASGGKAVVRGDAFLSLLLFEADVVEKITDADGRLVEKVYRGGSKGAFEMLDKLKPGDVIALLNPKILKPYQRSNGNPHPVDNILAVTPESASSVAVLGKSRDLGRCGVRKRDGNTCGGWCDKRVSEVCDYHVQSAVQQRRAARPEFSAGTGGMSTKAAFKRKPDYDPARQWGLRPEKPTDGATYIVSGHIVSAEDRKSMFAGENMGREGQAKAKRKMDQAESEKLLRQLALRDRDGMAAVMKAREALPKGKAREGKGKARETEDSVDEETEEKKKVYSSTIIRSLGFDPTVKAGHRRIENSKPGTESKFEALQALSATRSMTLGRAPKKAVGPKAVPTVAPKEVLLDSDSDENQHAMVDLDDF